MTLSKLSINYIKSLVNMNNPTKVLLGRWNIKENTKQIDIWRIQIIVVILFVVIH